MNWNMMIVLSFFIGIVHLAYADDPMWMSSYSESSFSNSYYHRSSSHQVVSIDLNPHDVVDSIVDVLIIFLCLHLCGQLWVANALAPAHSYIHTGSWGSHCRSNSHVPAGMMRWIPGVRRAIYDNLYPQSMSSSWFLKRSGMTISVSGSENDKK